MTDTFPFEFDDRYEPMLRLLGIHPGRAHVEVTDERFEARFGPWFVQTPLANIDEVEVTGPHRPIKAIGPRLSPSTRNLTFGSNADRTVRVSFRRPVTGIDPWGAIHHPTISVSVADPEGLRQRLEKDDATT